MCNSFSIKYFKNRPQNSPQQLPIAEGFAKANSVFMVITLAKLLLR